MQGYSLIYNVWYYRKEDNEWNMMRVSFAELQNARDVRKECALHKDVADTMLTRTETALYSNLKTGKVNKFTQYSAIDINGPFRLEEQDSVSPMLV